MTNETVRFDPNAEPDGRRFRDALGRFATGVTVVTCASDAGPQGMTVNSFTSVSLDPPLVLWCPAKSAGRYDVFLRAERFSIHILSADQQKLCMGFAAGPNPFDQMDWTTNAYGTPILPQAMVRFDCSPHAVHDGGDHSILVGHVDHVTRQDGDPMIYYAGGFRA